MNKKAQAATEFISTYGFMILSIGIIISGLAYFGVVDFTRLLPKTCRLPTGLTCLDQKATPENMTLVIQNSMGFDIYLKNITLTKCDLKNPRWLESNKKGHFFLECHDLINGRYKTPIYLVFNRKDTNLSQNWVGELITRIPSNGTYY